MSKLLFLGYCRFVVSDTLDMAGAPDYAQLNHEYYMELWRSSYIKKIQIIQHANQGVLEAILGIGNCFWDHKS